MMIGEGLSSICQDSCLMTGRLLPTNHVPHASTSCLSSSDILVLEPAALVFQWQFQVK